MRRTIAAGVVVTALVAALTLWPKASPAVQGAAPASIPANIAVVDVEKVFNSLTERNELQRQLQDYAGQLQADLKKAEDDAKAAATTAQALGDGPEKRTAVAKAAELQISLRAKREVSEAMLDQRTSELFRNLFAKIQGATKKLAESRGVTMVIASDESVKVAEQANTAETQRIISMRRILFASKGHDLTDDLIAQLNNEFAASGKK
jgi:Skp family chaperone for outer membrane proteins